MVLEDMITLGKKKNQYKVFSRMNYIVVIRNIINKDMGRRKKIKKEELVWWSLKILINQIKCMGVFIYWLGQSNLKKYIYETIMDMWALPGYLVILRSFFDLLVY